MTAGLPFTAPDDLAALFARVRTTTTSLCEGLSPEDMVAQSMPDASPAKWHLAHTTWFFDRFVVRADDPSPTTYDALFNSYYHAVGAQHPRAKRGLLTRPSLDEVLAYRRHVDEGVRGLLSHGVVSESLAARITLGCHHEQQHQELVVTDLLHLFSCHPHHPAWRNTPLERSPPAPEMTFHDGPEGIASIGHEGSAFSFDNESPRHPVLLGRHALASRPVTNGEYRAFVEDGGYHTPALWLSDGWSWRLRESIEAPLYWADDGAREFTVAGDVPLDPEAPVCHVSFYEADAFARWAGARLPTEAEWELAASPRRIAGNLLDAGRLHPRGAVSLDDGQWFGDVWEWTASPYVSYPGFAPWSGALAEYNGKFMCNQMVLRGGSCATPEGHLRASYRNFFPPDARWQMSGIRLAK